MIFYKAAMTTLCGDPKECKFPDSYFGNIRPWDYAQVVEHGDFKLTDRVLECGALHSYFCVYLSQFVSQYVCTDNFYWASREYINSEVHQSSEEWCKYIMEKGRGKVVGEHADIQNLHYEDNSFDKLICISTIEHVIEDKKGIGEMMRVIKPGGFLLMTTEYNPTWSKPYSEDDKSYYRVYDTNGINELIPKSNLVKMHAHFDPLPEHFTSLFIKLRKD